ncbi:hypothetical protein K435DRAFT_855186 [Dendrothele bispora CBS 962.96]|uniref:Uncharacterized protein n=1 Tax=Dendrothele bispora (strain CBS 962.96) TaxID=1314807 RepID=A0A4S8MCZ2_DENBC|nr:hypothetical protein K435DRAFT_855186 [Dendrothele bispora CBS 962.96]
MNPSRRSASTTVSISYATPFWATLDSFRRVGANGKRLIGPTSWKKELSSRKPDFSRQLSRARAGTTASICSVGPKINKDSSSDNQVNPNLVGLISLEGRTGIGAQMTFCSGHAIKHWSSKQGAGIVASGAHILKLLAVS